MKKTKTEPPMKEYPVIVKCTDDPMMVALRYTRCPICSKVLDNNWGCVFCNIYITFSQTTNFKK